MPLAGTGPPDSKIPPFLHHKVRAISRFCVHPPVAAELHQGKAPTPDAGLNTVH